ncbi:MAG: hypothetical protein EOO65_00235 [Methanosarcinales archaeon]|nr:MAG: hypothetical protein EOO65_00235 [Methanosarcinales archaeon]
MTGHDNTPEKVGTYKIETGSKSQQKKRLHFLARINTRIPEKKTPTSRDGKMCASMGEHKNRACAPTLESKTEQTIVYGKMSVRRERQEVDSALR